MRRRDFVKGVVGLTTAWPLAARAQQPPSHSARIGILSTAGVAASAMFKAFREELRRLGHIEGQTVTIEFRSAGGDFPRVPALAVELVRIPVDIIVTDGTLAAVAAKRATSVTPIVMATVGDPVAEGIVDNLARPSANITGFTLLSTELSAKRLELLKEIVPGLRRVGVLWNPLASRPQYAATEEAARALGLTLESGEAQSRGTVPEAIGILKQRNVSALVVLPDALFWNDRVAVVIHATAARWPAIFPEREYIDVGGLLAYGPDVAENFRRAAGYVDRIIKGAKPADLPVQQPAKFELAINLQTAKALGLEIPPGVLAIADEVIE
jgi:putative tryptophan/tyrosine transport system substrate-binding protein